MPISRRLFVTGTASAALFAACSDENERAHQAQMPEPTKTSPELPKASPSTSGPARFIQTGPRDSSRVALTFHGSGDPALTLKLLTIAKRLQAVITVFAVGQWLEQYPNMAQQILANGHELANHTYTHPALGTLERTQVATEIRRCSDVLTRQVGNNGIYFRASGIDRPTPLILEEAGTAGYPVAVGFDVDPHDYADPGAHAVITRVERGVRAGSIVSLHLGHLGTVEAFDRIVNIVRAKGLSPVSVRNLIDASSTT
jgi:peptidoglycan/xylan/chitin deacetylase (PgdA/CDA1 family)